MAKRGRASVWICKNCGFIGFYKPELDEGRNFRQCPSCRVAGEYKKADDIAIIAMEVDNT